VDATVSDSLIGRVLDGRYRVEARIARGGMPTVYRALDLRLDRVVALTVMHQIFADDDEFVARFIREAKSAARLSHPNVVAVYDQGDDGGHVFLAMEYVPGRTLRDLIRERSRLSPNEALSILQPVLAALSAAHAAGLVHRDVKPENVLLADDGRVKVADFGLARAAANLEATSATTLIGTVAYLAPEQVIRGVADPRSDVYAAGIMLFEMLTGRPPYQGGETAISVALRHAHEDVPRPSSLVPGIPASVDDLVARATARDPDLRPRDAGAFLSDVVRVRRGLPALDADAGDATTMIPRMQHTLVVELPESGRSWPQPSQPQPSWQPPPAGPDAAYVDESPARPRRRRRKGWIAFWIVLLLAVGAGTAGWYFGIDRTTTVPSLFKLTSSQAQQKAAAAHITLATGASDWNVLPAGEVFDQNPALGAKVHKGAVVTVRLSKGPHVTTVPAFDPAGQTPYTDYQTLLQQAGLHVASEQQSYDPVVPAGNVISVDPVPGQQLAWDKSVTVTVSQGPAPIPIVDYTGKAADQATQALTAAGFVVNATQDFSDTVPAGTVISQTPNSGTGKKNDPIAIDVSKGPQLFKVPNVTSDLANPLTWTSIEQATRTLEDAGFKVKVGKRGRFGVVTSQSPKGGSMQPAGTVVTIDAS
jgi:serine/threonine protein kinase/beta-lactam-binding protein with PASTA domain